MTRSISACRRTSINDGVEPWLNLTDAARLLKVSTKTLRLAAEAGEIEAVNALPDGPWVFARSALATDAAQSITAQARQNPKYLAGSHPAEQNLFVFNHIYRWVFRCAVVRRASGRPMPSMASR